MSKSNKASKSEKDSLDRDLSHLMDDPSAWAPLSQFFDIEINKRKDKTLTIRLSSDLLEQVKKSAKKQKVDIQKLVRQAIMEKLAKTA